MSQVLEEVSKPFFTTLQRWIFSGELRDPFNEFFVQLNPETQASHGGRHSAYGATGADAGFEGGFDIRGRQDEAGKVWEKKYVFVKSMVPGFVNEEFAKKVSGPPPPVRAALTMADLLHRAESQFHPLQLRRWRLDRDAS